MNNFITVTMTMNVKSCNLKKYASKIITRFRSSWHALQSPSTKYSTPGKARMKMERKRTQRKIKSLNIPFI